MNDEFDPTAHDKEWQDELFTTDFSDMETELMYKRYKLLHYKEKINKEDL